MANKKFFTLNIDGKYIEDENGYIPGICWIDEELGHEYRCIVNKIDFNGFSFMECGYTYIKQIKPVGLDTWLKMDHDEYRVSINNQNYVNTVDGKFIENPHQLVDAGLETQHTILEEYSQAMPQFDYFIMLVGKNLPGVVFSLFGMMIIDILRLENKELDE